MSLRFIPAVALLLSLSLSNQAAAQGGGSVTATGPDAGTTLEDRVEITWSTANPVASTSMFQIRRGSDLIATVAAAVTVYEDFASAPGVTSQYCVSVQNAAGATSPIGCDAGAREVAAPTGFQASDGRFEGYVLLSWSDRSQIEAGFNVYRDAGYAIDLDGTDDFVSVPGSTAMPASFTFSFWASRASSGKKHFVVNLESSSTGDPSNQDLEIGFTSANRFVVAFGSSVLSSPATYTDALWHHYAFTYDAASRTRTLYVDGAAVASDVSPGPYLPNGTLEFGRQNSEGNKSLRGHFHGKVDEVRLWNVDLSEADIRSAMTEIPSGLEADLVSYWPMDVTTGVSVPDVVGDLSGVISNTNADPTDWSPSNPLLYLRRLVAANVTSYADRTTVPGYREYSYRVLAFEDSDRDGAFTDGIDYPSEERTDTGWRAELASPGAVSATDGQFTDRVRITWIDRSDSETNFNVYRADVGLIGSVPADSTRFDDLSPILGVNYEYCVTASNGVESEKVCDDGMAGGLPAPANVAASNGEFDDRVRLTWSDLSDTEDGFEIFRDGALIGATEEDAQEFNDITASQGVSYAYAVRAFSKADPQKPSYSATIDAPAQGLRATVLPPENLAATNADFENRVELTWTNPSTTAMLFKVFRGDLLIDVLDFKTITATDKGIVSDQDYVYTVVAATVVAPSMSLALQGQVAQVLQTISQEDAVRLETGGEPTSAEAMLAAVYASVGLDASGKTGETAAGTYVESTPVTTTGSRSILSPTDVDATDNEFESHVELTWSDNSRVETGYYIWRSVAPDGPRTLINTLKSNRETYDDHTGKSGVAYTYTVQAFDDDGVSAFGITPATPDRDTGMRTLQPPTAFEASDGTSETVVELEWADDSEAEKGYNVYRRGPGSTDAVRVGQTGANETGFTDVVPDDLFGEEVVYTVSAFDSYDESLPVSDTGNTALEAPANLNASDVYDGRVVLVWVDRSEVEDGYAVTRREVGSSSRQNLGELLPSGATTYTDADATPGREYEYCVTAVLESGAGRILSDVICDLGLRPVPPSGGGGGGEASLKAVKIHSGVYSSSVDGAVQFGRSVAMDESFNAVIGAPGADEVEVDDPFGLDFGVGYSSGEVRRYTFNESNEWTLEEVWGEGASGLDPFSIDLNEADLGYAVDIDGTFALIGDPFLNDPGQSSYSIFKAPGWNRAFNPPDLPGNTGFSVALDGIRFIAGNPLRDLPGNPGHGGAIICAMEGPDCAIAEDAGLEQVIPSDLLVANAEFGYSVDLARDADTMFAIVGAPGNETAFLLKCGLTVDGGNVDPGRCDRYQDWEFERRLVSRFGPNRRFGTAVAINAKVAVVGAPGGEGMVVYEREDGVWFERSIFSPPSDAAGFGSAVAVFDTTIVVGAPNEEIAGLEDAGAVYVVQWSPETDALSNLVRYDARVAGNYPGLPGKVVEGALFGASVDVGSDVYLVGAPKDEGILRGNPGAAYSIPIGLIPPDDLILPSGVNLAVPGNIRASDGTAPDRIQVRWDDESDDEDGHLIFRSNADGELEELDQVAANVEFFDDFEASPGEAYTYCVAAFYEDTVTKQACDIGWRPPNGTIAGRLAARGGGGTEDALVCLMPNPNRSLLFDGFEGFVEAAVGDELDLFADFTIEAWVRPQAIDGTRYIAAKDSAYGLAINSQGRLRFTAIGIDSVDATAATPMEVGRWYHVAASMDRDWNVTFYVDGVREAGRQLASFANTVGDTLTIGQRGNGFGFFNGEIDELRIWDVAQSDSLIELYRFEMLEGDEENLVGYWQLDQGVQFVVPDITKSAGHGRLINGVYLTDEGAPLNVCDTTSEEGNYSIAGIRYGDTTEFNVIPSRADRDFEPSFKKITLSTESPVQNEVGFTDVTTYSISGVVRYRDVVDGVELTCPAPQVKIHVDKSNVTTDENVKKTTGADGSYRVSVDPSTGPDDRWFVIPEFVGLEDDEIVHTFEPQYRSLEVDTTLTGLNFDDQQRHTLSGHFSGGDPEFCGEDIGTATIRIYTQDGCYDRTEVVSSSGGGAFSWELPPLNYLVEIESITGAPTDLEAEIIDFFDRLGTLEVDLTGGDVERNLVYRAPLTMTLEGLDAPTLCEAGIRQKNEDGGIIRTLPNVPTIGEFEFVPITIRVQENYGPGQVCDVGEGTVTIFDAIADRVDKETTLELTNGVAVYETFGASANIFSGARIQGVDRSFQKPITVVAQVEGREPLTETRWALVEGFRERSATFVSATTEEFPLLIVHDPPGSNSNAFLEEGSTFCSRIANTHMTTVQGGAEIDLKFGFNQSFIVTAFGVGTSINGGAGFSTGLRLGGGEEKGRLQDGEPNREICLTTTERFETSSDPGGVGEDVHIGVALNLIFAIADVLDFQGAPTCEVSLSETLAADLDEAEPFQTSYVYTKTHIASSLIPELETLIRLAGGDATLVGDLDGDKARIRLQQALDNWKSQLSNNERLKNEALAKPQINRSFSGNTAFSYSEAVDTTTVTHMRTTRVFFDDEAHFGGVTNLFDYEQEYLAVLEFHEEWLTETDSTETRSKEMGYVLNDEDTGDYFSVDVAKDPRYGTFVFGTRSGRSSNPWEANTQKRDNPIISIDPPVLFNVDPDDAGSFEVTLINGSESNERRLYALAAPAETNRNNLTLTAGGGYLDGEPYLLDPGKAITIKMDVLGSSSAFSHRRVGVVLYPEVERELWTGDTRQSFALADTAFFSVYFDSTGGNALASMMQEGWTWFSLNREGGDVNTVLREVPTRHGDRLLSQRAESRFDSTLGWTGGLTRLVPGEGYRIRLQESAVFRIEGDPVEQPDPIQLTAGWNWIGYLPPHRQSVDDALASLQAGVQEGDIILGQRTFAQFVEGRGWIGTLQDLVPGESYAVHLANGGELLYSPSIESTTGPSLSTQVRTVKGPEWDLAPEQFDAAMTMVADVRMDGIPQEQTTSRVAVFAGDSLRGVADLHYVEPLDRYLAFVMIYGSSAGKTERLRVHVYDGERDELYEDVGSLSYAALSMLGSPSEPVALELSAAGSAPELMAVPETFALHANYPNPFNPTTTIAYDLPEASNVHIVVYDVLGRQVSTLVNGEYKAGHHKTVFDATGLASGFYLYRLQAGDFTAVHKMILIK